MIIRFGANTWRSGHSSFPASRIRSETAPAIAANSGYGHHRAANRQPLFLVKSPSGEPRTASTRKTAALPDRTNCRSLRPNGNDISSEGLPTLATTGPTRISGHRDLVPGSKFGVTKINTTGPGHRKITDGRVSPAVDGREICHMATAHESTLRCRPLRTSGQVGSASGLPPHSVEKGIVTLTTNASFLSFGR
jgi:hypothetical protein